MNQPSSTSPAVRVLPWVVRAGWVAVGVLGSTAIGDAVDGRSAAVRAVALWGSAVLWLAGVAAVALGSTVSLAAARVIVPVAVPASIAAWVAGASASVSAAAIGTALVTTVVLFSGEVGQAFVQASAYGHEQRFPLRPPPAYLTAGVVAWVLAAGGILAGPLLLASRNWLLGVPVTALAAIAVFAWPRWYRLARRWLVIVPAGVVIHDHLVLAETVMIRRIDVAAVGLAPADTDAADLTGLAPGHALEIRTTQAVTAIYAGTPSEPRGRAIHLTACLVSPTRPGRALAAATA